MECHFQDFVIKIVIYILLADSLYCLLGLHALMKHATMLGDPCGKELRAAMGRPSPRN